MSTAPRAHSHPLPQSPAADTGVMKRVGKREMRARNKTRGLNQPGDQKKLGLNVDKKSTQSAYRGRVGG